MLRLTSGITVVMAAAVILGCTKPAVTSSDVPANTSPTVVSVETRAIASPGKAATRMEELKRKRVSRDKKRLSTFAIATPASPIIASKVTFDKAAILNRVFLYGSDLQYSSLDQGDGMLLQSMTVGHVTARFQILGDRLQLVAEEKYRYESNINIPLRLIQEWPILSQTPDQLTVDIVTASPILSTVIDPTAQIRTSWVRSVEFVPQGSYLLIESSIELADGKVAEFMESLFPRETLVNSSTKPLFADPSREEQAGRFGFLGIPLWATFADGRTQTAVAQRFPVPAAGQTIDWYVTPNIPAEFIAPVQEAVEGWNRYSQKMWGRDFIKFKGLLPAGVKIGDPRYNIINWDSVVDASAAYESQASDPETGIQSHSLIYLPYAWVKIGQEFWERGELTQDRTALVKAALDKATFLGRKAEVRCFKEGALGAITPHMKTDPQTFSKALLRGTLFHEVGHALGLAHNFKGSLSWDPDVPGSMFSTSIMDYNHYDIEENAFDAPTGTSNGPLLEYDRQIISVLYNDAKDIAATDAKLPHCDDTGADLKIGGVDPFCIRYDSGKDPSVILERTLGLIQDPAATLGKTKSLASAAKSIIADLGDVNGFVTDDEIAEANSQLRSQISGLFQYYVSAGAQGLNYMMSANLRNLATFQYGTLPQGVDDVAMRARIAGAMDQVMTLEHLSPATQTAFAALGDDAVAWLKQTPWHAAATPEQQKNYEESFRTTATDTLRALEASIFLRVRVRQLHSITRSPSAPFFLASSVDYETKALGWIETVLMKTLPSGTPYSITEKGAAAQTLATFKTIPQAIALKAAASAKLELEIPKAKSAEERESLRGLLALLQ